MKYQPRYTNIFSIISYGAFFLLASCCYYFSISEGLFAWFFPDELAATIEYKSAGLLKCIAHYYFHTSINRISADIGVCWMAQTAEILGTPFLGWVFVRSIFYCLIPVSMAFLLREILNIAFKVGLLIALFISTVALFVVSDDIYYIFGLDLAIYATATITFFTLVALFPKSLMSDREFSFFCLIYTLNLNSHEVFLVISGLIVPMFAWHRYILSHHLQANRSLKTFVNYILTDRKIRILLIIYIISACATIFAPGLADRQHLWPSTGTFFDGFLYALVSMEETIYFIAKNYVLALLILLLGFVTNLSRAGRCTSQSTLLYLFLFMAPLLYQFLIGYLIGITPSLTWKSARTDSFQWIEALLQNREGIIDKGGFSVRQILFLYTALYTNIFLSGFFIAQVILRREFTIKNAWPLKGFVLLLMTTTLLFHPDGIGSMKVLSSLLKSNIDKTDMDFSENETIQPHNLILSMPLFLKSRVSLAHKVFHRERINNYQSVLANLAADRYFKANFGRSVSSSALDQVHKLMNLSYSSFYSSSDASPWIHTIQTLYNVGEECIYFSNKPQSLSSFCMSATGEKKLAKLLSRANLSLPVTLSLNDMSGVEPKDDIKNGAQLVDTLVEGEHFSAGVIQLSKGFNYLILTTIPTKTGLYFYMIGEKTSLLFPWLNLSANFSGWSKIVNNDSLDLVFAQSEISSKLNKLRVVIYSPMKQTIQLRCQHGYASRTSYKGSKDNTSGICRVQFGSIAEV